MSVITIYDTIGDVWKSNIGPSINSVPSDAFITQQDLATGNLEVINEASKEMAGGLVSANYPIPAGAKFFGFDLICNIAVEDRPHLARFENDVKITFPGGAQANVSCQWNDDKKIWQLGANDGSGWVDTTYSQPIVSGQNKLQLRAWCDGVHWSITALRVNDDPIPYVPDATKFANLPVNASGWSAGLHLQLQTEVRKAPWFLRESYSRVRVMASDTAIPWKFD